MNSILYRAWLVLCAILGVIAYIGVHEVGHALAAVATGRTVSDVTIFSLTPHVSLQGQSTSRQDAFTAAAGSALVVTLWFAFMLLRRSRRVTWVVEGTSFFAGIELLAWFVSSAVHTIAPPQNDVTKFIALSGVDPTLMALAVACISAVAASLFKPEYIASLFRNVRTARPPVAENSCG